MLQVADIQIVLFSVEETCERLEGYGTDKQLLDQLMRKVDEAGTILNALNDLFQTRLIIKNKKTLKGSSVSSKISWKWLKMQERVKILFQRLRKVRQDISADLTLITAYVNDCRYTSLKVLTIAALNTLS